MKIYFLRHAESNGNATNDYSTAAHDALSESGLAQSRELVGRLQGMHFDAVYCSPLRRAIQTILPYAQSQRHDVEIWPELAEACWQEDRSREGDAHPRWAEAGNLSDLDHAQFCFRDGLARVPAEDETYAEGVTRVRSAIDLLSRRHRGTGDTVLIVSHGYATARMIELLLGMEPLGRFEHANTGMSLVVESGPSFAVHFLNRLGPDLHP